MYLLLFFTYFAIISNVNFTFVFRQVCRNCNCPRDDHNNNNNSGGGSSSSSSSSDHRQIAETITRGISSSAVMSSAGPAVKRDTPPPPLPPLPTGPPGYDQALGGYEKLLAATTAVQATATSTAAVATAAGRKDLSSGAGHPPQYGGHLHGHHGHHHGHHHHHAMVTATLGGGDAQQRHSHSDDDSGCALEEYTWVPAGLRPDQVG